MDSKSKNQNTSRESHTKNETLLGTGIPCVVGNIDPSLIGARSDQIEGGPSTTLGTGSTCTEHPTDTSSKYVGS